MITIWVKFYNPLSIDNKCYLKQLKIERRANAKKANTPPFPHEARLIIVGARSTWKYAFNSPYIHICLATYLLSVFSFQCFSTLHKIKFEAKQTPSQKPSILYRNRTRNEPFFPNFRANPFGELDLRARSLDLRDQRIRRPWTCGNPFMWVYFYPYRSPFDGPLPRQILIALCI